MVGCAGGVQGTHSVAENLDLLLSDGLGIKELGNHLVDIHQRPVRERGRRGKKAEERREKRQRISHSDNSKKKSQEIGNAKEKKEQRCKGG